MTGTSSGRRLRVVTVVPSVARNTGGTAVMVIEAARAMQGQVDTVVYATDAAQPASTRPFRRLTPEDLPAGASDLPLHVFPTRHPYALAFSPRLWTALRQAVRQADLVTINSLNLFPQFAAFQAASRAGVPYIVTPHGALDPWLRTNSPRAKKLANGAWQHRMLTQAAAIHFTTEGEAQLAADLTGVTPHVIVPNGVDLTRFNDASPGWKFRRRHLEAHKGPIVLFLGRIAKKKGIDLLIRGFARATCRHDVVLVVAGPDDEGLVAELSALAGRLGIRDRVHFVGPQYREQQAEALAAANVWALTSHTENFGIATIEAMAAGCPVVVSTEVNLAPQIRAADAGVVVSLSVEEIAGALRGLLDDPVRRAALGSRGKVFARRFDWGVVAPQLVEAYYEVLESAVPKRRVRPSVRRFAPPMRSTTRRGD